MKKKLQISIVILFVLMLAASPGLAQENQPQGPKYRVKSGDTLWAVARNLHVSYDQLLAVNDLNPESVFLPGTELVVPGLPGVDGYLTTVPVEVGETLASLSKMYKIPADQLAKLNRLTSPSELYAGVAAVVMDPGENQPSQGRRASLSPGLSPLELGVAEGINPWQLILENEKTRQWEIVPGEVLQVPGTESIGPGALPEAIRKVELKPDRFIQGETAVIQIKAPAETTLQGTLGEYDLVFFENNTNQFITLQGFHAREETGIKPLSISGTLPDGTPFAVTQMVRVFAGDFVFEDINNVPPETVGLEKTEAETAELQEIALKMTANKRWSAPFLTPASPQYTGAYASYFGNRRSYNGSGYQYYHSGLDYFSNNGDGIFAAAAGKVAYTGNLLLHGNTTMLDHGWGIYTLYAHQSEILVNVGETVSAGDLIGKVGSTGRSTGPHLHWEVWVGGVQVNPLDWLNNNYP